MQLRELGYEVYTFASFVRTATKVLNAPFAAPVFGDQTVMKMLEQLLDWDYGLRRFVAWLEHQKPPMQAIAITGLDKPYAPDTIDSFCELGAVFVDSWPPTSDTALEQLCRPQFAFQSASKSDDSKSSDSNSNGGSKSSDSNSDEKKITTVARKQHQWSLVFLYRVDPTKKHTRNLEDSQVCPSEAPIRIEMGIQSLSLRLAVRAEN